VPEPTDFTKNFIPSDVFDHFVMKNFKFKAAKHYTIHLQNSTARFEAAFWHLN